AGGQMAPVGPEMLEQAIAKGAIVPWFQPKVNIASKQPVGVDALARWPQSDRGPIYPDVFIPVAEEYGLIDRLTFLMAEQAVASSEQWRKQGLDLSVAVNVAMESLCQLDFPERLEALIARAGSGYGGLQLEVTESQLMADLVPPLEVLLRLRLRKIRLSIDDFGTRHSNLSQLRDLPFDELKLDRSYVTEAADSGRSAAILESSIAMAKGLGLSVVAEGVETLEDWRRVEQMGCDLVQGYFIARPMPASAIPDWIRFWPERCDILFD
ncbi:MAG: EAL domain-containing protein, partial [Parahaliea sp.]